MDHRHRNVKHSDDHRRLLAWAFKSVARISKVRLPQTCPISIRPFQLPWHTTDIVLLGRLDPFSVSTHVDQIFLTTITRTSDSSTSILTFHLFSHRKPQWLPSYRNRFLVSVLHLGLGCARFCCLELPLISTLLDDSGKERTTVPEPSAIGTIIGGDAGLTFTAGLPEISLVGVTLGHTPLRMRSCAPNSIGESICSF